MDFSTSISRIQLSYENSYIQINFERKAWWGEVFFKDRFSTPSGPHHSFEEAIRACKLKAWKSKLENQETPVVIINNSEKAIVFQNFPSLLQHDNLLFSSVDFVDEDDDNLPIRICVRVQGSDSKFFDVQTQRITVPDIFLICSLVSH